MNFAEWLDQSPHAATKRLALALRDPSAGAADLAILLRGGLRAESLARNYTWEVDVPAELAARLSSMLPRAGLKLTGECSLQAEPWHPGWLADAETKEVDHAFLPELRRPPEKCAGDPMLGGLNLSEYTSTAQRVAVRSVLCAKAGDTVAVCLPTGSGKSLCAFLPALASLDEENEAFGVSVIVVPTVALGLDLQSRLKERVGHAVAYRPEERETAEAIRQRCEAGVQGPTALQSVAIVLTTPEPEWWLSFHASLPTRSVPTLLIAPSDLRCPNRSDRFVCDLLSGNTMSFAEWQNRFVA